MSKISENIIETAERLFYSDGFSNTGVDLIRDEANCSKTTMYKNFGSKDNLILEVLKNRETKFRSSLESFVGNDVKDYEAVAKIFEWHKIWFQESVFNGCLFVRASYELQSKNSEINEVIAEHKLWVKDFVKDKLTTEHNKNNISEHIMVVLEGLISLCSIYEDNSVQNSYLNSSLKAIKTIVGN